jgi:CxxC-x17-CxxC domain-containing protein
VESIDRDLLCASCGSTFVFSAGEQRFFRNKGYVNLPKHCRTCRSRRVGGVRAKAETLVQCAECGRGTSVPFKPTQNRLVYCGDCFLKQKQDQKTA